ncbi:4210_t:CDS:1 [Ambispora gerdemannii]|uniref:4210_t:CDS:1 n=1 Tax=Ambispora gerdemannii TaxID=144530 RepID=A0A9N9G8N8_9GLOM|nr:4210_t:CDS:1 [Ambispora gerdemannii]
MDQENRATGLIFRDEENFPTLSESTSNNVDNEEDNFLTLVVLPNSLELTQTSTTATQALVGNRNSSINNKLPLVKRIILFIALALAMFFAALDQTITIKAIPKIPSDVDSISPTLWIGTSYLFTFIATLSLYAKFSEIFGRKYTFIFVNSIFTIGSVLSGASQNLIMIIFGRSISGIGGGGIVCFTMMSVLDVVPESFGNIYHVIMSGIFVVATVSGPTIKGIFIVYASWRWVFFTNIPVSLFATIVVIIFTETTAIRGSRREKLIRIDYIGILLFSLSILANLLALDWAGDNEEWSSTFVILFLVAGLLLFFLFIFVEFRIAKEPLIPFKLFKTRNVLIINICNFIIGMAIFSLIHYIPIYLQIMDNMSVSKSGIQLWPLFIGLVLFSLVGGIVTILSYHFRPFITIGFAAIALAIDLIRRLNVSSEQRTKYGELLLAGAGIGASMQTAILLAQQSVKHENITSVTCLVITFQTIGSLFGIAISEAIYNTSLNGRLKNLLESTDVTIEAIEKSFDVIRTLNANLKIEVMDIYINAVHKVFCFAIVCAAVATVISLALKRVSLSRDDNSEVILRTQGMRQL